MTHTTAEKGYTPRQRFALARLEQVAARRAEPGALDAAQEKLLRRALYTCYLDCLDAGLAAEARAVLSGRGEGDARADTADASDPPRVGGSAAT
ncbi:MAG: hypothetical protein HY691_01745 [Chloroflexi bacterium]|nr:hypothetical protein [Chloroflexota bacterium]